PRRPATARAASASRASGRPRGCRTRPAAPRRRRAAPGARRRGSAARRGRPGRSGSAAGCGGLRRPGQWAPPAGCGARRRRGTGSRRQAVVAGRCVRAGPCVGAGSGREVRVGAGSSREVRVGAGSCREIRYTVFHNFHEARLAPMSGAAVKVDARVRRTRRRLQDALVALVLERGYEAVTIRDVAERADVGYATFFRHYASKEALLLDLLEGL